MKKIAVGVLGATGIVGQSYLSLLQNHPWFEVTFLAASSNSAKKSYEEAISRRWHFPTPLSEKILKYPVHSVENIEAALQRCQFVFSALPNDSAKVFEKLYAENGFAVVSNASAHRNEPDIPLLIPEINFEHIKLLESQKMTRGWKKGFIVTKPNCSIQSFMLPLNPLHQQFKIKEIHVATMQAISGAGYPGVSSFDIIDNVIPYIVNEEEKTETEPLKIWGTVVNRQIVNETAITISAHCNRVPVMHGHMANVSVKFHEKPELQDVLELWKLPSALNDLNLPTLPVTPTIYRTEVDRPQPRLDRDLNHGMSSVTGRLRPCNLLDLKFTCLSHNTFRGAAGGGVLNAELLTAYKMLPNL